MNIIWGEKHAGLLVIDAVFPVVVQCRGTHACRVAKVHRYGGRLLSGENRPTQNIKDLEFMIPQWSELSEPKEGILGPSVP